MSAVKRRFFPESFKRDAAIVFTCVPLALTGGVAALIKLYHGHRQLRQTALRTRRVHRAREEAPLNA